MKKLQHEIKSYSPETGLGYFINSIITARVETGFRSNSLCLDEDVNIYLARLLLKFTDNTFLRDAARHVCLYESDLVARQEGSLDMRERFNLYKATADYILFTAGICGGFNRNLPQYKTAFRLDNDVYLCRARCYYAQAAEYIAKLKRGENSVSEVLRKISANFTVYLNILFHIRENFFHFTERFSDGEWFHFVHKNIIHKPGVDSKVYVAMMDDFLSRISAWKNGHGADDKDMLRIMCAELKRLNPDFHYDVEGLLKDRAVNAA